MTMPPTGPPTGPAPSEDELRDLFHSAVADVEPAYRLDAIRDRTAGTTTSTPTTIEEGTMTESRRTWLIGAGGAVVATAAVIVTVALVGTGGGTGDEVPTAGTSESSEAGPTADPSQGSGAGDPQPSSPAPEPEATVVASPVVPAYSMVGTPMGPRLVREFRRVDSFEAGDGGSITAAVLTAVGTPPGDADYQTLWPDDTGVEVTGGGSQPWSVRLTSDSTDLSGRPGGIDGEVAAAMIQQVVWTAQGVVQDRAPITVSGPDGGDLLGSPAGPVQAAADVDVLALMNVTTPAEGQTFDGDVLTADGRSSGFEATVSWEVADVDGELVDEGVTTAEGWIDGLYPWTVEVDLSDLEPGEYTFTARNDDPTGGAEGMGDSADDKTFVVE